MSTPEGAPLEYPEGTCAGSLASNPFTGEIPTLHGIAPQASSADHALRLGAGADVGSVTV